MEEIEIDKRDQSRQDGTGAVPSDFVEDIYYYG